MVLHHQQRHSSKKLRKKCEETCEKCSLFCNEFFSPPGEISQTVSTYLIVLSFFTATRPQIQT